MGLSVYNIIKWTKMLTGNSIMHVNQDMGKCFVPGKLEGYFNNLTEKVLKDHETLKAETVPLTSDEKAGMVYFPVAVFQYGLGAYDLYLLTKEECYLRQFHNCVDSAIEHQEENGSWNNFGFVYPEDPYGAMCQGEGASLLLRAYKNTGDNKYLESAKKAIDFMLIPIENGGTTRYIDKDIIFLEYTNQAVVLNGWIFALYGLYDLCLSIDDEKYKDLLDGAVNTLSKYLPRFDNDYWSMYDLEGRITSPFYHNLHIAQLKALKLTFGNIVFANYEKIFQNYQNSRYCRFKSFIVKAYQKIKE